MSNIEAVIKVTDQLISRVFNQQQFTNGEINFLTKQYGGQKIDLDNNFDRLLKMNENVCLIADTYTPDLCSSHDTKAKEINDQVTLLSEKTERILKLDDEYREQDEKKQAIKCQQLKETMQECAVNCRIKLEKLKELMVEEELELERKYLKFEENLDSK